MVNAKREKKDETWNQKTNKFLRIKEVEGKREMCEEDKSKVKEWTGKTSARERDKRRKVINE